MTINIKLSQNLNKKISDLVLTKKERDQLIIQAIEFYLDEFYGEKEARQKKKNALSAITKLRAKSGNWNGTKEIIKWRETK